MADAPTPEQSARAILAIFAQHNVRAGEILMPGQLNSQFLMQLGSAAEYASGIRYAFDNGWLSPGPTGSTIVLTDLGFDQT